MSSSRAWLCLLLVIMACARAEAEDDTRRPRRPLTALEAGPLGRADLVLLARVEDVRVVRGMILAQVRVERAIRGRAVGGAALTLLVRGPRTTQALENPDAAYLPADSRGRWVFFLERGSGGVAYSLDTLFEVKGEVGRRKLASLESHARLLDIPDEDVRARATLSLLLEEVSAKDTWTKVHALRELNHLATVRPDVFDLAARRHLTKIHGHATPAQRAWLVRLGRLLEDVTPGGAGSPGPARAQPVSGLAGALREAASAELQEAALRDHLDGGGSFSEVLDAVEGHAPALRRLAIDALADRGSGLAWPRIRSLYGQESDAGVLQAIVRAAGLLGGEADVAWLEARLANPRLERDLLFALARIRSPAALEALARHRARRADEGASPGIVALIDYLRSAVFVEVEAGAGRGVGPARGR